MTDLSFVHCGSTCLIRVHTEAGQDWCAENLPDEAVQWTGAIVVKPRYLQAIADGAASDGLTISSD